MQSHQLLTKNYVELGDNSNEVTFWFIEMAARDYLSVSHLFGVCLSWCTILQCSALRVIDILSHVRKRWLTLSGSTHHLKYYKTTWWCGHYDHLSMIRLWRRLSVGPNINILPTCVSPSCQKNPTTYSTDLLDFWNAKVVRLDWNV